MNDYLIFLGIYLSFGMLGYLLDWLDIYLCKENKEEIQSPPTIGIAFSIIYFAMMLWEVIKTVREKRNYYDQR